jgi:hypothetical protein
LLVGSPASRIETVGVLQRIGFASTEADDPYDAMAELCRRPLIYRALVLSLGSLYREELTLIAVVKRRFPHIEIWLTQTDGRAAALADGMRLGADGLLGEDGLHRIAVASSGVSDSSPAVHVNESRLAGATVVADAAEEIDHSSDSDRSLNEPVLTADELRALLQEQTYSPGDEEA